MSVAVPKMTAWMDELIEANTPKSRSVAEVGFPRLREYFPDHVLRQVRVVTVSKAPFPPFAAMDLREFLPIEQMAVAGITYRNFCFLHEAMATESTCFHEMVHALEWRALGRRYMTTYAAGLLQHGYARSPLEVIAFDMQSAFDREMAVPDIVDRIEAASLDAAREADAFLQLGMAT